MTDRNVWIFIEQEGGKIADLSLELLAKGQELAQTLGGQVWALLCGYQIEELAESVIQYGADHVLVADHPELEIYRTLPYTRVAADLRARAAALYLFSRRIAHRPRSGSSRCQHPQSGPDRRLHRSANRRICFQEGKYSL